MTLRHGIGKPSIECKCDYNFTCGYCLRNAPPYFFTPTKGVKEMTVMTRCDCCLEARDDIYKVTRYGEQIQVDSWRVIGLFSLCTDCEESGCIGDLTDCKRPTCEECGIKIPPVGNFLCDSCYAASWAFGTQAEQAKQERLAAVPLPLFDRKEC